jgi:putative ATP-binding cassette transporter
MRTALTHAGLEHLVERLDDEDTWANVLSGGEQQRVSFARLLLHKPDIVVMDESTSALDTESQEKLMTGLGTLLPDSAIISVGHRAELESFHDRKFNLVRSQNGAKLISEEAPGPPVTIMNALIKRWRGPFAGRVRPGTG